MRRVFLSYRRDDSQTVTGFIFQHLEALEAFGPSSVFMDIDDIPDGVDFRDVIDEALSQCEFFLQVIGPRWVTPRLMDARDWVRVEIESALNRKIPVVPVLVYGAMMPKETDLPPSLHPLLSRQARTLRHGKHFRDDVLDMVKGLHRAKEPAGWSHPHAPGADDPRWESTGHPDSRRRESRATCYCGNNRRHTPAVRHNSIEHPARDATGG